MVALREAMGSLRAICEPNLTPGTRLEAVLRWVKGRRGRGCSSAGWGGQTTQPPHTRRAPAPAPACHRAAMVALAQELVLANAVLSGALTARSGERPPQRGARAAPALPMDNLAVGATLVEFFAKTLVLVFDSAERPAAASQADEDFTVQLLSAGAISLASSSASLALAAPEHAVRVHVQAVYGLLEALHELAPAQPGALARLRGAASRPEAVLACLRQLFSKDWGAQGAGKSSWDRRDGTPEFPAGPEAPRHALPCPPPLRRGPPRALWKD